MRKASLLLPAFVLTTAVWLLLAAGAATGQTSVQAFPDAEAFDPYADTITTADELSDEVILQRLNALPNQCISPRVTPVVRSYLRTYVQIKSEKSRIMLGKRLTYFPLFEQKLREEGMPEDLKYLAVVESALNPRAVSRVGATGLWQFMPATGKEYDLRQSSIVDERSDAVKSTEAAVHYLKDLYRMFDDWALALAAYNSGPGRVSAAIKRAHSKNFWKIQPYLPKETRNYVPAFIAASYICNFYMLHGVDPELPVFDEQLTAYLKVTENLTFNDIAAATGLDLETLSNLNASYKRGYIPDAAGGEGYYLLVPQRVMPVLVNYLNDLSGTKKYRIDDKIRFMGGDYGDGKYAHMQINVQQNESIAKLAEKLGCSADQLKAWNMIHSDAVAPGQKLKVWRPIQVLKHEQLRIEAPKSKTPAKTSTKENTPATTPPPPPKPEFTWHTVKRAETLTDISRKYQVSTNQIIEWNQLKNLKAGMRLKIKQ